MAVVPVARRRRIVALARGRCEYCRLPESHSPSLFAVDHILPRSREGGGDIENLALACPGCNGTKYDKIEAIDPATGALVPLFHPRRQRWSEHFMWSEDRLTVLGRTATGRATIAALHLNREGTRNLRDVLMLRGLHPPSDD